MAAAKLTSCEVTKVNVHRVMHVVRASLPAAAVVLMHEAQLTWLAVPRQPHACATVTTTAPSHHCSLCHKDLCTFRHTEPSRNSQCTRPGLSASEAGGAAQGGEMRRPCWCAAAASWARRLLLLREPHAATTARLRTSVVRAHSSQAGCSRRCESACQGGSAESGSGSIAAATEKAHG